MPKIEVKVNGEVFPCRSTMGAMLRFKEMTGKEVTEIDGKGFSDLCAYLYCCVKSASAKDGKKFDMSFMEFADSISPDDMQKWADSVVADNSNQPSGTDEQKKISE